MRITQEQIIDFLTVIIIALIVGTIVNLIFRVTRRGGRSWKTNPSLKKLSLVMTIVIYVVTLIFAIIFKYFIF